MSDIHGPYIDTSEHELSQYDKQTMALSEILRQQSILTTDEVRRTIEDFNTPYDPYYQNRIRALIAICVEKNIFVQPAIQDQIATMQIPEQSVYENTVRAFTSLLVAKNVTSYQDIQVQVTTNETRTPALGASVVARAWLDADYKNRLLRDARSAISEMAIALEEHVEFRIVENTPTLHHVVVCTLCSCYPRALLGEPPEWYKSMVYRQRVVSEPRQVLLEMGLILDEQVKLRIVDSTADVRYLVIPRIPNHIESLSEDQAAQLVTRDSMIGVAHAIPIA